MRPPQRMNSLSTISTWHQDAWVLQSLMKLLRTSSANIFQGCQKFFHMLPISNFIDIRTAGFGEKTLLQMKTTFVDYLFAMLNVVGVFFATFYCYDIHVVSTCNLRSVVSDIFFRLTLYIFLMFKFIYVILFSIAIDMVKKDEYKMSQCELIGRFYTLLKAFLHATQTVSITQYYDSTSPDSRIRKGYSSNKHTTVSILQRKVAIQSNRKQN